jgi:hypothetical protein
MEALVLLKLYLYLYLYVFTYILRVQFQNRYKHWFLPIHPVLLYIFSLSAKGAHYWHVGAHVCAGAGIRRRTPTLAHTLTNTHNVCVCVCVCVHVCVCVCEKEREREREREKHRGREVYKNSVPNLSSKSSRNDVHRTRFPALPPTIECAEVLLHLFWVQ